MSDGRPRKLRVGRKALPGKLRRHVEALQGERHWRTSPRALEKAARYIADTMEGFGLDVELEPFTFRGGTYENVVARKWGTSERDGGDRRRWRSPLRIDAYDGVRPSVRAERERPARSRPRVLIGAHFDTVSGSPGADDNASGVAGLLEAARILSRERFEATIELVGFNLEELQTHTYRVGSRAFVKSARRRGVRYAGALILEMIGYTTREAESQRVPRLIRWRDIPRTGDFLAATGDGRSRKLLGHFRRAARDAAPGLPLVTHRTPFRGWIVLPTRLSDNASFWSAGYPSLMITDTAFLRNPNYHGPFDTADTLDYDFMAAATHATIETARRLARPTTGE